MIQVCNTLIANYLLGRKQYVKVNSTNSDLIDMQMGVPQGSILGPLLFTIYINSLLPIVDKILSYADDTAVVCSEDSWHATAVSLTKLLNKIYVWLYKNKLSLNIIKTKFIAFSNQSNSIPEQLTVLINGQQVERSSHIKYLGIFIDENLKWDTHINYVTNKLKYFTFITYKLKNILSSEQLKCIYYALFNSLATYGIIAWGGTYCNHIRKLVNLQNNITKIIFNSENDKVLSIRQSFFREALTHNYDHLKQLFNTSESKTRNKALRIPLLEVGKSRKCFDFVSYKLFNLLPNNLKSLNLSRKTRNKNLKNWLLSNIRYEHTILSILN